MEEKEEGQTDKKRTYMNGLLCYTEINYDRLRDAKGDQRKLFGFISDNFNIDEIKN